MMNLSRKLSEMLGSLKSAKPAARKRRERGSQLELLEDRRMLSGHSLAGAAPVSAEVAAAHMHTPKSHQVTNFAGTYVVTSDQLTGTAVLTQSGKKVNGTLTSDELPVITFKGNVKGNSLTGSATATIPSSGHTFHVHGKITITQDSATTFHGNIHSKIPDFQDIQFTAVAQ